MLFFFSFAIVAVVGIVDKSIAIEFNPKNYGEKETQSQLEINFSVIIQFIFFLFARFVLFSSLSLRQYQHMKMRT